MLSITTAQLDAWIVAFAYPLTRVLAFIATSPLWGSAGIPRRTRLILGIGIAIAIAPALPAMPTVAPGSLAGLWILAQQMLIGIGMGFAARIVFAAVDVVVFVHFTTPLTRSNSNSAAALPPRAMDQAATLPGRARKRRFWSGETRQAQRRNQPKAMGENGVAPISGRSCGWRSRNCVATSGQLIT